MFDITFYGVRGSTPCSGPGVARYGGNTSCAVIEIPGESPILCDIGTGARYYGLTVDGEGPFRATALLTHLHWDHIQGLPFFTPALQPGARLEILGPPQDGGSLDAALRAAVAPPVFPIGLHDLPSEIVVDEFGSGRRQLGSARITAFAVDHVGPTVGYRIDAGDGSAVYISDHQQPQEGMAIPEELVEICRGVDVLIHDAQYSLEEFAQKRDWGHCTIEYAVEVARACEARRLVLYHHDPAHDDAWIDDGLGRARRLASGHFEVIAAAEGMVLRTGTSGDGDSCPGEGTGVGPV